MKNVVCINGVKVLDSKSNIAESFGSLITTGNIVETTKGDLTVRLTKNASGNYATSYLVFSTTRDFYYSFSYRYDGVTNVGRTGNVSGTTTNI
jgi:hypothetical protein